MNKKLKAILIVLGIIIVGTVVASGIYLKVQKREIEKISMEYIHLLNKCYHPNEILKKGEKKLTSDDKKILEDNEKKIKEFVDDKSSYYKRIKEDINEILHNELKLNYSDRIKSTIESCKKKVKTEIAVDEGKVTMQIGETSVKFGGEKGSTVTTYIFDFVKNGKHWIIENVGYNYTDM